MTDELRERLARLDPMPPDVATDPIDGDRARTLLESIVSTTQTHPNRSRGILVAAAAAVVALLGLGAFAALRSDDSEPTAAPVELSLSGTDTSMQMCMMFDPANLAPVEVAFGGTVTSVDGGTVTLDVDHWYRGGDSDTVTIAVPEGFTAALDGVDFVVGERYLVSATDGVVTSCGLSGPATPELQAAFDDVLG